MKFSPSTPKTFAYPVTGEIILPGTSGGIRCMTINSRAYKHEGACLDVAIAIITKDGDSFSYVNYHFDTWFTDWTDADNMRRSHPGAGRTIEIAVPVAAYQQLLTGGELHEDYVLQDRTITTLEEVFNRRWDNPTVAGVRIGEEWIRPSASPAPRLLIEPRPVPEAPFIHEI